MHAMSGNQPWLALSDGRYSPRCTTYSETWHHRDGVEHLLLEVFHRFTVTLRVSRV